MLSTTDHNSILDTGSTPAVGSSRYTTLGSWINAIAILKRRFIPPDNDSETAFLFCSMPTSLSNSGIFSFISLLGTSYKLPKEGLLKHVKILINEDFPAPFGPRIPNTSPALTSKETPFNASTSPYLFFTFSTTRTFSSAIRSLQPHPLLPWLHVSL